MSCVQLCVTASTFKKQRKYFRVPNECTEWNKRAAMIFVKIKINERAKMNKHHLQAILK